MTDRTRSGTIRFCPAFRRIRILFFVLICLAALSGGVLAHPPADVAVGYYENTGDLAVTITHQVDDPATHYAKQVTVRHGESVLIDNSYTSQPDRSSFTYRYNLPHLKESIGEIRVDVQCSQFGSRSGILLLTRTLVPGTPGSASPAVPAPTKSPVSACAAIVAVGFAVTIIRW